MPLSGGVSKNIAPLGEQQTSDFNAMNRAQMEAYAEANGIDLSGAANNAARRVILQGQI